MIVIKGLGKDGHEYAHLIQHVWYITLDLLKERSGHHLS